MNDTIQIPPLPLSLRSIYVAESSCNFGNGFDPLVGDQKLEFSTDYAPMGHTVKGSRAPDRSEMRPTSCTFLVTFRAFYHLRPSPSPAPALTKQIDESTAAATIKVTFAVDYLVAADGPEPTEELLQQWGTFQPMIHAWSYWREYCHSNAMRMNMPVVMVPLLILGNHKQTGESVLRIEPPSQKRASAAKAPKPVARKRATKLP